MGEEVVLPLRRGGDGNSFYFPGKRQGRSKTDKYKRTNTTAPRFVRIFINLLTESFLEPETFTAAELKVAKDKSILVKSVSILAKVNI